MNLFEDVLIDVIFILFPLIIYNLFLASNKNISSVNKKIFFSFSLFSSFFLVYRYSKNNVTLNLLILSSLVLIGYLKKNYVIANIIALMMLFLYYGEYNYLLLMMIPYLLLNILNIFNNKLSDYFFIDIFLLFQYICFLLWIKIFNFNLLNEFNIINLFVIMVLNYFVIHIIYYLYDEGDKMMRYHLNYKELLHEKQIRLSLFKITHEIKNPIAVIKAYLDMLNVNDKKQVMKYIPIIRNEIDRLLILLQDFMLVNKSSVEMDIMDINMLLEEVIESLKPLFKQQNIILKKNIIDDEIYVNGDYKRLGQVLINLIKNGVEAMDKDKGEIIIRNIINNNKLDIIIEDNGSGISRDTLDKLKTPFFTTKKRGTGLGLALSDEIIKAHNGNLTFESAEGKGTKVIVEIPYNREENYA